MIEEEDTEWQRDMDVRLWDEKAVAWAAAVWAA